MTDRYRSEVKVCYGKVVNISEEKETNKKHGVWELYVRKFSSVLNYFKVGLVVLELYRWEFDWCNALVRLSSPCLIRHIKSGYYKKNYCIIYSSEEVSVVQLFGRFLSVLSVCLNEQNIETSLRFTSLSLMASDWSLSASEKRKVLCEHTA